MKSFRGGGVVVPSSPVLSISADETSLRYSGVGLRVCLGALSIVSLYHGDR